MKTIDDFEVAGLRVLVRADLNVPLDGGRVADDGRIRASLPTLTALTTRGAKVIVCAHLGRPGGKPDPRYSLAPVAARFGAVHRKHASVYDVALRLPHAAGYLVQAELTALSRLTADIRRPYIVVLGGAKVTDKFEAIGSLITTADRILIGGAMAFPFLTARGGKVGTSLLEAGQVDAAAGYLDRAAPGQIELPSDVIAAAERTVGTPRQVVAADAIPADQMGLDIGPESAAQFAASIRQAS